MLSRARAAWIAVKKGKVEMIRKAIGKFQSFFSVDKDNAHIVVKGHGIIKRYF